MDPYKNKKYLTKKGFSVSFLILVIIGLIVYNCIDRMIFSITIGVVILILLILLLYNSLRKKISYNRNYVFYGNWLKKLVIPYSRITRFTIELHYEDPGKYANIRMKIPLSMINYNNNFTEIGILEFEMNDEGIRRIEFDHFGQGEILNNFIDTINFQNPFAILPYNR